MTSPKPSRKKKAGPTPEFRGDRIPLDVTQEIVERKRIEASLRHNCDLLFVLSLASQSVQQARTPEEIYSAVGREVKALKCDLAIFTPSDDRKYLSTTYTTFAAGLLRAAEKLTGIQTQGYLLPIQPGSVFTRVIDEGNAVFLRHTGEDAAQVLPKSLRPLAEQLVSFLKVEQGIVAPLRVDGAILGVLTITGSKLEEGDVPAVEAFAAQVAISLKNVRLTQLLQEELDERRQAEEALRIGELRFRSLIEHGLDNISLLAADGSLLWESPAVVHTLGYEYDQFKGRNIFELMHPDDMERAQLRFREIVSKPGNVIHSAFRLKHSNGSWRWMEGTGTNLLHEPSINAVVINYRDITESKQAEEKLIVSETRYRRLFEAARDGILILDAETGVIMDVNPFLCEMLSFSHEEICGKELWELGFFKDIVENKSNFLELQQKGYIRYDDLPLEIANGQKFHVEFVSNVYQVNHHNVVQCNIRDITERKRTESALRESEDKFKYVFDHSVIGKSITMFSGEMNVNRAFCEILGYTPEELKNRKWQEITHPDDLEITQREIDALLSNEKESTRFIKRYIHKNGSVIWAEVSTALRCDANGRPLYFLTSVNDITGRKQAEDALKEYNTRLEAAVEARASELRKAQEQLVRNEKLAVLGQLAGGVGHELRNPLAVINNALYYLKQVGANGNEKVKEYLGIIQNETHNAEKIINDLLDFARIKSVDVESVSASELTACVLAHYPVPKTVGVRLEFPEDLPLLYVDPHQAEQVLGNLVINACQAMSPTVSPVDGELVIKAHEEQRMIAIAIKDNGMGIPPENMDKIFEPLFTTKAKGIGLGLAVSRKLAEANGGRIEVQSEAGRGSTFTLYLPAARRME